MRFIMNYSVYMKEKNIPSQTIANKDLKEIKIKDDGSTVTLESSAVINEEKLRANKGIIIALILCIPFWIFTIKFIIWLVQK